jgi:hypothetical protein
MGTTQAHISGQGSSTVEEVARQKTFHLKQRTNKHGEVVTRGDGKTHQATLASAVVGVQNWPTANARDWKDSITGTHPPSRPNLSEQTLGQAVSVAHGHPAPANPSTAGNRPESWATPNAFCYQPPENTEQWTKRAEYQQTEKGVNLHKPIQTQVLHEVEKSWPTITANTPDMESNGPNGHSGTYLAGAVKAEDKQWATPQSRDAKGAEGRMIREGQSTDLPSQTEVAPTGQWNRANGKLNPRWVETLMGLPVGWVMPSCKSPVTIEQTNCDSSATESSQPQQREHSELF